MCFLQNIISCLIAYSTLLYVPCWQNPKSIKNDILFKYNNFLACLLFKWRKRYIHGLSMSQKMQKKTTKKHGKLSQSTSLYGCLPAASHTSSFSPPSLSFIFILSPGAVEHLMYLPLSPTLWPQRRGWPNLVSIDRELQWHGERASQCPDTQGRGQWQKVGRLERGSGEEKGAGSW